MLVGKAYQIPRHTVFHPGLESIEGIGCLRSKNTARFCTVMNGIQMETDHFGQPLDITA